MSTLYLAFIQPATMQFNDSPSHLPPPNNPILEAYLNFKKETPLVTRYVITSQVTFFLLSYVVDPTAAVANIPHYAILQYQVYRIVLSPFLCNRFLSLVFAYFNFTDNGRRLERSMGSTAFLVLVFSIGITTNLFYISIAFLLKATTGSESLVFLPTSGIWIVLFGIVSIECSKAPPQTVRKLLFMTVTASYYPIALFGLFSLVGGFFELSYLVSIGVGYAFGNGYMDRLIPGSPRCKRWEEKYLYSFATREGWVGCDNILGSGAWNEDTSTPSGDNASSRGFFSQIQQKYQQVSTISSRAGGGHDNGASTTETAHGARDLPSFPASGGQKLGSASRRPSSSLDARQARLQAIEKRMEAASQGDIVFFSAGVEVSCLPSALLESGLGNL
eukprot:scaffold681_cov130-Cylindrotheca_fusiformis.AAC.1